MRRVGEVLAKLPFGAWGTTGSGLDTGRSRLIFSGAVARAAGIAQESSQSGTALSTTQLFFNSPVGCIGTLALELTQALERA